MQGRGGTDSLVIVIDIAMDDGASAMDARLMGQTLGGAYRVLRRIGGGGMGQVYRATQAGIEREVAVKVLRPELAHHPGIPERFRDRIRILL